MQRSTIAEIESSTESFSPLTICAAATGDAPGGFRLGGHPPLPATARSTPHLLRDMRDVMVLVGLYTDLLDAPGVLQPRYRKYGEDLRMLGERGGALIERLMEQVARGAAVCSESAPGGCAPSQGPASGLMAGRGVSC